MMNKIKLKDIAQICKVSPATVSFVINNKNRKGISASTWNKIEKCLKKHNYLKTKNKNSIKRIIFCLEDYTPLSASRILKGIDNDTLFKNEFTDTLFYNGYKSCIQIMRFAFSLRRSKVDSAKLLFASIILLLNYKKIFN